MNSNILNNENNMYLDFKNFSNKKSYFRDDVDLYFYYNLYLDIKEDIGLKFYNLNENNFVLCMTIMLNSIFGNYDFYKDFIKIFVDAINTSYISLNNIYNDSYLKLGNIKFLFKKSLLETKYFYLLNNIKHDFFNLSFSKKFTMVSYINELKAIFYLNSLFELKQLKSDFFFKNNTNDFNLFDTNQLDRYFLNNYFFKKYVKVNNVNTLYTLFNNYTDDNSLDKILYKNNINIDIKDFLFSNNLKNKLIIRKYCDGYGIFSKKISITNSKKSSVMISFFKKTNNNYNLYSIQNILQLIQDKNILKSVKIPKKHLGENILLKYVEKIDGYTFLDFKVSSNIFNNVNLHLTYLSKKNILIINSKNSVENLYYYCKKNHFLRVLQDRNEAISIANYYKSKNNDIHINIKQIILPYEYLIIQIMASFIAVEHSKVKKGGDLKSFFSKKSKNNSSNSIPKSSKIDIRNKIKSRLKNKSKPTLSSSEKQVKKSFFNSKIGKQIIPKQFQEKNELVESLNKIKIPKMEEITVDFDTNEFNINNFKPKVKLNIIKNDNEYTLIKTVVSNSNSIMFLNNYYKTLSCECKYYKDGFLDALLNSKTKIESNIENIGEIKSKLRKDILKEMEITKSKLDGKNTYNNKLLINSIRNKVKYIEKIEKLFTNKKYFNEQLMFFQYNKNLINNFYNLNN